LGYYQKAWLLEARLFDICKPRNPSKKKVRQQGSILHQKRTLLLVRLGYANVNIMKAIFG
jgi:hypothetical protein